MEFLQYRSSFAGIDFGVRLPDFGPMCAVGEGKTEKAIAHLVPEIARKTEDVVIEKISLKNEKKVLTFG